MGKQENKEQKPKKRSRAGLVLLILLLILAGAVGFLYYTIVKAPLETDDYQKLAASAPMSPAERFRFSAADNTVQVKLDKTDIWNVFLAHTGRDFLDVINEELSSYSLAVSGCAIDMDEEGLRLNLELQFRETRLVAKVPCDLEISGQHLSLKPAGVKLGVISLPVEGLLSSVKLEYDLSLPVISDVTGFSFGQDALLLTGTVEEDIRALVPQDKKLYQAAVFSPELKPLADVLRTAEGFGTVMAHLEQNPEDVEDLYRDAFKLSVPERTEIYLENRFGLTERFFPGVDFDKVAEEQSALSAEFYSNTAALEQFFTKVVGDYNDKKFRLSKGEFLKNNKPFQAALYNQGEYDGLFEVLNPEEFFLILVDVEDGYLRNTSSFYKMADEKQEFTQAVDFNKTYILGCVLRGVTGDPFVMYETEVEQGNTYFRSIVLRPLTEEDVENMKVPGKFGVWTG